MLIHISIAFMSYFVCYLKDFWKLRKNFWKSWPQPINHYKLKDCRQVLRFPIDDVIFVKCVQTHKRTSLIFLAMRSWMLRHHFSSFLYFVINYNINYYKSQKFLNIHFLETKQVLEMYKCVLKVTYRKTHTHRKNFFFILYNKHN